MKSKAKKEIQAKPTLLKKGDTVMVIAGGNKKTNAIKGQTGKIVSFVGSDRQRAIVEGLNLVVRHTKAKTVGEKSGKIKKEAPINVSRLMYFADKINKPVRLCTSVLADGKKVRGYKDKESKSFVQIAE
jgi:large subunit ribosomal protein L24